MARLVQLASYGNVFESRPNESRMRGQAATEYILISSVAMLIIVPSVFFFYQFSQGQAQAYESSQILRIGDRLALTTQTVYNGGLGTRTTITDRFPSGLINITFTSHAPGFGVGGEYTIYYDPDFSGRPLIYGFPVNVPVFIDTASIVWGEGQRRIRLDVQENSTAPPGSPNRFFVNVTVD